MENLYEITPGGAVNFSIAFAATDTTKTLYFDPTRVSRIYPYFYRGFLTIPDWTNVVTLAATFTDSADGNTKTLDDTYTALAKNGVRELAGITVEVPNRVALTLTLSGAPGGTGGTIYGTLYSTENASGASSSVGPIVTETNSAAIKTAVEIMDDWDESDRAKVNPIVGQAGIASGAGAVGATVPRVTLSSDDPAVTAVQIMDDWDESDRAKVNPIVGQAGIAANAGAVGATVPRVTLASDDPGVALLTTIDADTGNLGTISTNTANAAKRPSATVNQARANLPASSTASPAQIAASTSKKIIVTIRVAFQYCWAADQTAADARFAAGTINDRDPGCWEFESNSALNLYVRNAADALVSNGVSYDLVGEA
jgi:hypothetical protein